MAKGDDGDAVGFQHLQRFGNVEDGFGPGSDHGHRGLRQFQQVGRYVEAGFGPAMDAADAASGEHRDAGQMGGDHGGGDGGGPGLPGGDANGEVGAGKFQHVLGLTEGVEFGVGQADVDLAAHHGDGGGGGAVGANLCLDQPGGFDVLREGHAVGDDGGFQRHDRAASGAGLGDFGGIGEGQGHVPMSPDT